MNMKEWAKNEIELACKRERGDRPEDEWDYGVACYESALKAYNSLMEDGHSGMSIGLTKSILNRLIDGKPLGPITEDEFTFSFVDSKGRDIYRCNRMSGLFKNVDKNNTVTYDDVNRFVCVSIDNEHCTYHAGYINKIINNIVGPITLPYMPEEKPYYVYCEDLLFNPKNGDFDTVKIHYYIDPDGNKHDLNYCIKCDTDIDTDFVQISEKEFDNRKFIYLQRVTKGSK